jgi:hypothetical protein
MIADKKNRPIPKRDFQAAYCSNCCSYSRKVTNFYFTFAYQALASSWIFFSSSWYLMAEGSGAISWLLSPYLGLPE